MSDELAAAHAEFAVLTTDAGRELLSQVMVTGSPGVTEVDRWRRSYPAALVAAAIRLVEARRRARTKIDDADTLWLERIGVEQATPEAVARHKAARLARLGAMRVWDVCCGLGFDTLALGAAGMEVVAVDLSHAACWRTRWNTQARGVDERVAVVRGRAERIRPGSGEWMHVDPDRRATSGRSRGSRAGSIEAYAPSWPYLRDLVRSGASGAIKLSPASDFAQCVEGEAVEVEVVSLGGECKEARVWFGDARSCRRRATCLPAGTTWTERDGTAGATAKVAARIGTFVFDPDPALVRAGLLDAFASTYGLARLAEGVDWLTGDDRLESPFVRSYRVIDALPADDRRIRVALAGARVGALDVRLRGVGRTPEDLRRAVRLRGERAVVLFLHGGGRGARGGAVVAEPA